MKKAIIHKSIGGGTTSIGRWRCWQHLLIYGVALVVCATSAISATIVHDSFAGTPSSANWIVTPIFGGTGPHVTVDGTSRVLLDSSDGHGFQRLSCTDNKRFAPTQSVGGTNMAYVIFANMSGSPSNINMGLYGGPDFGGSRIELRNDLGNGEWNIEINNGGPVTYRPLGVPATALGTWCIDWSVGRVTAYLDGVLKFDSAANLPTVGDSAWSIPTAEMGPQIGQNGGGILSVGRIIWARCYLVPSAATNVSVQLFGAVGNGADATSAMRSAIDYATAHGLNVLVPSGTYGISSTIGLNAPMEFKLQGTLVPVVQAAVDGTALIKISASNVTVTGEGGGGIDGVSPSFNGWLGVYAATNTGRLQNVVIQNLTLNRLGQDNISAAGIYLDRIDNAKVLGNVINDTGVISGVAGGGFGIYLSYCSNGEVGSNILNRVGSTAINNSAGLNTVLHDNHITNATLFGMKGGYGTSFTVSGHVSSTTTSFAVDGSDVNKAVFKVGLAFFIKSSSFSAPKGVIQAVQDFGAYLLITVTSPMAMTPTPGEELQLLDTNALYLRNTIHSTGDNGFDQNGAWGIQIVENRISNAGLKQDVGVFQGLHDGIWIGYDPQGDYNYFSYNDITISNNVVENTGGSAIALMGSPINAVISSNRIVEANLNIDPASDYPGSGGIEVSRLTYYRGGNHVIRNNHITSSNGYGIFASFSSPVTITNNTTTSRVGIVTDANQNATVSGNNITVTGNWNQTFGVRIADASGANPSSGISVVGNTINVVGTQFGYGVWQSDMNASAVTINANNISGGANLTPIYVGQ